MQKSSLWKSVRRTVAEKDLGTDTRPASVESVRHAPMTQLRIRLKSQPQGPRPSSPSAPPARSHHFLANLNLSVTPAIASSALPPSASSSVTPHPTPPAATRSPLLSRLPFSRDSFFFFFYSPAGCFPLIFTASPLARIHARAALAVSTSSACSRIVFHHFILSASVSRWVPLTSPLTPHHSTWLSLDLQETRHTHTHFLLSLFFLHMLGF